MKALRLPVLQDFLELLFRVESNTLLQLVISMKEQGSFGGED